MPKGIWQRPSLEERTWAMVENMTHDEIMTELDSRGEVFDEPPTEEEAMNHLYEVMIWGDE